MYRANGSPAKESPLLGVLVTILAQLDRFVILDHYWGIVIGRCPPAQLPADDGRWRCLFAEQLLESRDSGGGRKPMIDIIAVFLLVVSFIRASGSAVTSGSRIRILDLVCNGFLLKFIYLFYWL